MSLRWSCLLASALLAAACSHKPPPTQRAMVESAFTDARAEARALITDPDRAARADELLAQLQQAFEKASASSEALAAQVNQLDRRQDATAEQFQAVLAAGDDDRGQQIHTAAGIREQLARLLTREEWQKLVEARRKLLQLQLAPQPL